MISVFYSVVCFILSDISWLLYDICILFCSLLYFYLIFADYYMISVFYLWSTILLSDISWSLYCICILTSQFYQNVILTEIDICILFCSRLYFYLILVDCLMISVFYLWSAILLSDISWLFMISVFYSVVCYIIILY